MAQGGQDHVYGDSDFNIDIFTRVLTVVTTGPAGSDRLFGDGANGIVCGDGANDIVFGDHGIITQTPGTLRILTTGEVIRAETTNIQIGESDVIFGGVGDDALFGGLGSDYIGLDRDGTRPQPEAGRDYILGDHGFALFDPPGSINQLVHLESTDPLVGHPDWIDAGRNEDVAFGGTGDDQIWGGDDHDILLGDHGLFDWALPPQQNFFSIFSGTGQGAGNDTIHGDGGDDFILGQQGADTLFGDAGKTTSRAATTCCSGTTPATGSTAAPTRTWCWATTARSPAT